LSFSQIYRLSSQSLQKRWKYLIQPPSKYKSTNEKRQNSSYATKGFIFLYLSEGTWIISCTDELVINHHVPVHSLHSMVAKMIHLQILTENVLVTTKLTLRWLMSYIYGAPILDVSRSHTTTQHSR
jgi:hypothetical protein